MLHRWFAKKRSSLIIACHDGSRWRARQFHFHHGEWHAEEALEVQSRNGKKLPKQVFELAAKKDVQRLRILLSGDLHALTMDLPDDADKEEIHTALVYEAAEEFGADAHMLRVAAVRAESFRMGAESNVVVTAGFELRQIEAYAQECERNGLEFDGIGSLELATLSRHARLNEEARLLILRRQSGIYVTPASESAPFMISAVPFGVEAEDGEAWRERAERTIKRMEAQHHMPLRIVATDPICPQVMSLLPPADGNDTIVVNFHEYEEDILRHVAWAEMGGADCGCAMVGPPPLPRDPYRAGTYLFILIIVMTAVYCAGRWHTMRIDQERAQQREQAWKNLQAERDKAKGEYTRVNGQYKKLQELLQLLQGRDCLPVTALPLLNVLATETPKYSRITRIEQMPDGKFEFRGLTRWQDGLRQLSEALTLRELERTFSSESKSVNGEQAFTFQVWQKGMTFATASKAEAKASGDKSPEKLETSTMKQKKEKR